MVLWPLTPYRSTKGRDSKARKVIEEMGLRIDSNVYSQLAI